MVTLIGLGMWITSRARGCYLVLSGRLVRVGR